jgi:hypothetical protein
MEKRPLKNLGAAAPGMGIDGYVQVLPIDTSGAPGEVAVDPRSQALALAERLDIERQKTAWFGDLMAPWWCLLRQGQSSGESLPA